MNNYDSIAMTLESIARLSDKSLYYKDFILDGVEKEEKTPHLFSTLSIPKSKFLQIALQNKNLIVLGYSCSDFYDIVPILTSSMLECDGIWIEHTNRIISKQIEKWKIMGKNRIIVQPEEVNQDMTAKVSRYLLNRFASEWQEKSFNEDIVSLYNKSFKSWIYKLRLRPGDGLFCLAKLYLQKSKCKKADLLLRKAIKKYEEDIEHNEWRWLRAKSDLAYNLGNMSKEYIKNSLDIYSEIQHYIETNNKKAFYPSLYAGTIVNLATRWINTPDESEAIELINKAMLIAEEVEDFSIITLSLRISGDRYLKQTKYRNALKIYRKAADLAANYLGNFREACLSLGKAGLCLMYLGDQYEADKMLDESAKYANLSGDLKLIGEIQNLQVFVAKRFLGHSSVSDYHKKFLESAQKHMDDSDKARIDELLQLIRMRRYELSIFIIDSLLKKYDNPDIQAWLLWNKSNIFQRTQKNKDEIELLEKIYKLIKPIHPLVEHNLGLANAKLNNYEIAEKHFLNAIEYMKGEYPLAICNLGIMYINMGRISSAKKQLSMVLKLKEKDIDVPEYSLNFLKKQISLKE